MKYTQFPVYQKAFFECLFFKLNTFNDTSVAIHMHVQTDIFDTFSFEMSTHPCQ